MLAADKSASSDKREKQKANRNICHFFSTKQGCKFGDNCKFQHEVLNPGRELGCVVPESTSKSSSDQLKRQDDRIVVKEESQEGCVVPESTSKSSSDQLKRQDDTIVVKEESQEGVPDTGKEPLAENPSSKGSNQPGTIRSEIEDSERKICHHYLHLGWCRFGKRCRFSHPKKERGKGHLDKKPTDSSTESPDDKPQDEEPNTELQKDVGSAGSEPSRKSVQTKVCRFYLNGYCRFGRNCRYLHSTAVDQTEGGEDAGKKSNASASVRGQQYVGYHATQGKPTKTTKSRGDLTQDDIKALNATERNQLKKRFPEGKLEIVSESEDECCYKIQFVPTDPDWPFDIREFLLKISIPSQYPLQMFVVELPDDGTVPDTVRRHIEVRVREWLEGRQDSLVEGDTVELVFRPFLRWLDRNLENIVTEGLRKYQRELAAKAAGFEFIPARPPGQSSGIETDPSLYPSAPKPDDSDDSDGESDVSSDSDGTSDNEEDEQKDTATKDYSNVERKGTEITLRHLQLKDQAATIVFHKISIVIQCMRCKTTAELFTPAGRLNSITCVKCNNEQRVMFRPAMAHHFSAVIGYLDLAECSPFDLVLQDSTGSVSCINCSRDMALEGFCVGQVKQTWCRRCHQKLSVATDSVRFQQLQPSDLSEGAVHQVQVSKVRRLPKDPAIQEGKPLPAEGTCKHYKKSFRWLRFPCCGKCYPCDICHDDKEGDHEMKFASRMICGFCCKEQPYTVEKPCVLCGSQLTKTRSIHWEGGRGCRDKIRMGRNDSQKFANMNKTISKKAQEKLENKKSGKKTTKLRHA